MYAIFVTFITFLAAFVAAENLACGHTHIIVARASEEKPGTGMLGPLAAEIQRRIPDSHITALDYPAKLDPYIPSQTQGVATLSKMIHELVITCPSTKLVLLGYSQGAHVTADVVCGASEPGFPATVPMGPSATGKISAIILMGDPSHVANASYNEGTSHHDGIFMRRNPTGCNPVADRMISFCDANDLFCDSGNSIPVHLGYAREFGTVAADFVVAMVNKS
ncbi:Fc.00g019960.m01.CDS01 [Cosmosporella sp. VM-42]